MNQHIFSITFINVNGFILAKGTDNAIPRVGEKVRLQEGFNGVTFVVTDIIHNIKPNGQAHHDVDIHVKPV